MVTSDKHCALCECELTTGDYGHNPSHITGHHRIARRLEGWVANLKTLEGEQLLLCYECHEEVLHNPVLLPGMEQQIAKLFAGKSRDEKVMIFAEVIERGAADARP